VAEEPKQSINQRLVFAIGHPARAEILELLIGEKELSSNLIAEKLGAKVGSVSYHLTVLEQCEAIELARTEQHRGVPERFFRPVPKSLVGDGSWQRIPPAVKSDISAAVLQDFIDRASDFEPRGRA
jgi:DNA-binding transcriptional ArsR family regulator